MLIGRREKIRTSVRWRSPRGIGCARESACGGPASTQCVLAFPYLRATSDRNSESFHRREKRGTIAGTPFVLIGRREKIRTSDPYHPKVVRYQAAPRAVSI